MDIERLAEWMGWEVKPYYLPLEGTRKWIFDKGEPFQPFDDWNPYFDDSDAFMLLDRAAELGYEIILEYIVNDKNWHCTLWIDCTPNGAYVASSPDKRAAIVGAVEKVIGV